MKSNCKIINDNQIQKNIRTTEKLLEGWTETYKTHNVIEEIAANQDLKSLVLSKDQCKQVDDYLVEVFKKGQEKGSIPLPIFDLLRLRVLVQTVDDVYKAYEILE